MKDKEKTFKEIVAKEEGILIIAVLAAMVMAGITIYNGGTDLSPIVSSMLWTSIVGLAVLRVIKAAVKELKK